MIIVKNLTKCILGEPLFEKVSFVLTKGDKVGLVGPNGCGKSTLLKMILGEAEADSGSIQVDHERIGYLPQQVTFQEDDASKLSSGQKTKLALEKVLFQKPTVLILDEPTNHLDTEGLEWLEGIINEFRGIVFVISHDRKLLDNCVDKIFEIDPMNHKFNEYRGGYTLYLAEKRKALTNQEEEYRLQQREKRRLENWLALKRQEARLHPDPAKGKKIRAMEKRLEREIYSQEIVKPKDGRKIRGMELRGEAVPSKLIIRCTNISKSFGEKLVVKKVNMEIRGEERVLLAGANGSGKTTLLKIISGELTADSGTVKVGEKVHIGYFAQEHETLDLKKTVLEEFLATERLVGLSKDPRAILGAFLFTGQDVFKKVAALSSGERVRLVFAKLTHQINELLILDEPTNHLDIASREIIENALIEYKGAILAVSHDRYFVEKVGFERVVSVI